MLANGKIDLTARSVRSVMSEATFLTACRKVMLSYQGGRYDLVFRRFDDILALEARYVG
jgi:hypothetical protein